MDTISSGSDKCAIQVCRATWGMSGHTMSISLVNFPDGELLASSGGYTTASLPPLQHLSMSTIKPHSGGQSRRALVPTVHVPDTAHSRGHPGREPLV
jgi:hypothetical protein